MKSLLPTLRSSLIIVLLVPASLFAQYTVHCPYLQNPSLAIGYIDSCAAFWENSWDSERGGYYTNVDRMGFLIPDWGTNKNMLNQSRNAYGLVRAYMVTGDTTYLDRAHDALVWMIDHAWDQTEDGWIQRLDQNGVPIYANDTKTAFYQHYALLGIAAYVEATQDSAMWSWLLRGYQYVEDYMWDDRSGVEGYYNQVSRFGTNPQGKSFNATVDAVTTHLLALERLTGEQKYVDRLRQVGDEMVNQLVARIGTVAIGFPQEFDSDWNVDSSQTQTLMGHVLKTGWCLARLQQVITDPAWLPAAETAVLEVWNKGYDHTYGGPYKDYDWKTGEEMTYNQDPGVKAWWQMEQAVTAGLQLYRLTRDDRYLEMADETLDFFMNYFVDHIYGEVYADRTRLGATVPGWGDSKASDGKAGYHSIETGYYTYTYGGLMLTGDPVSLHYRIAPADSDRILLMRPIALDDNLFTIAAVTLDSAAYEYFDATAHMLTIPAGTGGEFVVTYQGDITTGAPEILYAGLPSRITIANAYPNPFNGRATVVFNLPSRQNVRLVLYDVQGREVQRIVDGIGGAGQNVATVDASRLSSGVYFLHLATARDHATRRLVLIK